MLIFVFIFPYSSNRFWLLFFFLAVAPAHALAHAPTHALKHASYTLPTTPNAPTMGVFQYLGMPLEKAVEVWGEFYWQLSHQPPPQSCSSLLEWFRPPHLETIAQDGAQATSSPGA